RGRWTAEPDSAMRAVTKNDFPVSKIRRFLEPGPIVLVSSAWKGETNIMTMGWHTVMEFEPSLVGCMISSGNHSFGMIKASKECVINIPTFDLANQVQLLHHGSGEGARGRLAQGPAHHPLSRWRRIHGVRPGGELSQDVQ